jgi:hypothetical protein
MSILSHRQHGPYNRLQKRNTARDVIYILLGYFVHPDSHRVVYEDARH